MKWFLPFKTTAFAVCVLAFLIAIAAIFYGQLQEENAWSKQTAHTYQVLNILESIRSAEKVLEVDHNDYLSTGEERLLVIYQGRGNT